MRIDDQDVIRLFGAGLSDVAIARELGCSRTGVIRARERNGLMRRGRTPAAAPIDDDSPTDQELIDLWLNERELPPDVTGARLSSIVRLARVTADTRLAMARARQEDAEYHSWDETVEIVQYVMRQAWDRLSPLCGEQPLRELDEVCLDYLRSRHP